MSRPGGGRLWARTDSRSRGLLPPTCFPSGPSGVPAHRPGNPGRDADRRGLAPGREPDDSRFARIPGRVKPRPGGINPSTRNSVAGTLPGRAAGHPYAAGGFGSRGCVTAQRRQWASLAPQNGGIGSRGLSPVDVTVHQCRPVRCAHHPFDSSIGPGSGSGAGRGRRRSGRCGPTITYGSGAGAPAAGAATVPAWSSSNCRANSSRRPILTPPLAQAARWPGVARSCPPRRAPPTLPPSARTGPDHMPGASA